MEHTAYCLYIDQKLLPIYGDTSEGGQYVLRPEGSRWVIEGNGRKYVKRGGTELGVYICEGSVAVIS